MKKFSLNYNILLKLLIVGLLLNSSNVFAQKTTIWLVRHAEKADVEISYYGTPHHSTVIPEERNRKPATIVHPIRNF